MQPASAAAPQASAAERPSPEAFTLDAIVLDVDYMNMGEAGVIRLTAKGSDGKAYEVYDESFRPYFYFVPNEGVKMADMMGVSVTDMYSVLRLVEIVPEPRSLSGKEVNSHKVFVKNPSHVPKLSAQFGRYGRCYEFDIPFAKRYVLDTGIVPLVPYSMSIERKGGRLTLKGMSRAEEARKAEIRPNLLCFDIEVYNPLAIPRPSRDPVIMISYSYVSSGKSGGGVITFKKVDKPFVETVKDETEMIRRFMQVIRDLDIDIITGYNSANFDINYLIERSKVLKVDFDISRFEGGTRLESHGLAQRVKCSGRVHVDTYLVVKFIATVGAAESILKLNSYTLKNVYEAIQKDKKISVEKKDIYKLWDGPPEDVETLAVYNMNDSEALMKVYDTFTPIMVELAKTTGDMLTDVAVSTPGQLVEFTLMRYAHSFNELIPNKPDEAEIARRLGAPIEGAYVKTPDPGVYEDLVIFDFRGLYPSIIISHNIDPSSLCTDCADYYESPTGARFSKTRKSTIPTILKIMIDQRSQVKKLYKKDPSNIELGSRSQALKIVANSFYGYLGYARSRWYSRDCAASVTAYGRQYIKDTISKAEALGFKVLYGDTDSVVLLLGGKSKDEALAFMKSVNSALPETMELELEDFFKRGLFVGKKTDKTATGAKKKYALISETGRIKIRGFELVRRDWSKIARETQQNVLQTILKEGDKEKAVAIVKGVINRLRAGQVPLGELVINTQLRKGIDAYDSKSPELSAASKAVKSGFRRRDEVEHAVIGYIITRHGSSVSEKAELEGMAQDYDPDYYINHQVLPATMRILKELGLTEEELLSLGKQRKL